MLLTPFGPLWCHYGPCLPVATSSRSQTLKLVSWAPQWLHSPPLTFTVRPRANPVLTRCDWKRMCYFYFLGSCTCLPCAVAFIWSVRGTSSRLLAWLLAYSENQKGPTSNILLNLSLTSANNLFLITNEQLSHRHFMGVLSFPSGVLYLSGVLWIKRGAEEGDLLLCRALRASWGLDNKPVRLNPFELFRCCRTFHRLRN